MWGDDPEDYRRKAYNAITMCVQVKLPDIVQLDCGCVVGLLWQWQWGSTHPVNVKVVGWKAPEKNKPWPGSGAVLEYRTFHKHPELSAEPTYHRHAPGEWEVKSVEIEAELMRRYRTHVMGAQANEVDS